MSETSRQGPGTADPASGSRGLADLRAVARRRWRGRLGRDRLGASVVALLGVAAALPSTVWPTYSLVYVMAGDGGEPTSQRQSFWSWDRMADTTAGSTGGFEIANWASFAVLVVALVVGLAGVVLLATRRGPDGRLLGLAGIAWLTASVAGSVGERLGRMSSGALGSAEEGITVETDPAGWLELAALVLLGTAVLLVALPPVVRLVRPALARARAAARRDEETAEALTQPRPGADGSPPPAQRPRVGVATIRDVAPGERSGRSSQDGGRRQSTDVGFSDDPGADAERFGPSR